MQYQTINPATGKLTKEFPFVSRQEIDALVDTAQKAYETDWRDRPVSSRAAVMKKAASILRERAEEYAQILTKEMGKRIMEARGEVDLSASILEYYAERAEAYLQPRPLKDVPTAEVQTHPVGVLLGIEPWNFPYYQVARVAGPQLMVGNVLMLKHAESVPQSALAFARLFEEAGAPAGVYTNLFATIDDIGHVIDDPRVRGVTLTGSERAGASVAERAGRSLKKVVLELGGSDPMIVLDDAPMDWAVTSALIGRMFNCGQCCVGTKRIIVVGRERGEAFLAALKSALGTLEPGDPADENTLLGPIASERALNNLLAQIVRAREGGAVVAAGGKRIEREGFYLEPTILTNIDKSNPIHHEELFGPVVLFYVAESDAEAVRLANDSPYGLGGSVLTADSKRGYALGSQLESGMVFVNRPFGTAPQLPFGGVKNSGYGRELSEAGFDEFVNKKLVSVDPVGTPPFGPAAV